MQDAPVPRDLELVSGPDGVARINAQRYYRYKIVTATAYATAYGSMLVATFGRQTWIDTMIPDKLECYGSLQRFNEPRETTLYCHMTVEWEAFITEIVATILNIAFLLVYAASIRTTKLFIDDQRNFMVKYDVYHAQLTPGLISPAAAPLPGLPLQLSAAEYAADIWSEAHDRGRDRRCCVSRCRCNCSAVKRGDPGAAATRRMDSSPSADDGDDDRCCCRCCHLSSCDARVIDAAVRVVKAMFPEKFAAAVADGPGRSRIKKTLGTAAAAASPAVPSVPYQRGARGATSNGYEWNADRPQSPPSSQPEYETSSSLLEMSRMGKR
jgi:hypothetical protein